MIAVLEYLNGLFTAIHIAVGRRASIFAKIAHAAPARLDLVNIGFGEQQREHIRLVPIHRQEFLSILWQATTDLMPWADASIIQDFQWQLEEQIGLICTDQHPHPPFHTLFECPLYKLQGMHATDPTVLLVSLEDMTLMLMISKTGC